MTLTPLQEDLLKIAAYMGGDVTKPYSDYETISGNVITFAKDNKHRPPGIFLSYSLSELIKYQTSYDWIFPVIKKIYSTGYELSLTEIFHSTPEMLFNLATEILKENKL